MTKNGSQNQTPLPKWLLKAADRIIVHMNSNHGNSIVSTLHAKFGIKDKMAKMESLQIDGYHISSSDKLYFAKFTKKCDSFDEYKEELIKHAQIYKNFEIS